MIETEKQTSNQETVTDTEAQIETFTETEAVTGPKPKSILMWKSLSNTLVDYFTLIGTITKSAWYPI